MRITSHNYDVTTVCPDSIVCAWQPPAFLTRLLALTYILPDKMLGDFRRDLDLEFSRSSMKFAISQPKMIRLPRNEKQTHRLHSRAQMWTSDFTLVVTLTLNFQGQIWNFRYLSQKWSDCHETKSKHIDWTLGLKCDHRIWPWPWLWPWIVKVKYRSCYILAKTSPIATKRKANISIKLKASNVSIRFDIDNIEGQMWPWTLTTNMTWPWNLMV